MSGEPMFCSSLVEGRVELSLFIVPTTTPGISSRRINATDQLMHYKCPTSAVFVSALPRNASGKLLKRYLRRLDRERTSSAPAQAGR